MNQLQQLQQFENQPILSALSKIKTIIFTLNIIVLICLLGGFYGGFTDSIPIITINFFVLLCGMYGLYIHYKMLDIITIEISRRKSKGIL